MKSIGSLFAVVLLMVMCAEAWPDETPGAACGSAQRSVQESVSGVSFKNHGQLQKAAAQALNPFLRSGSISGECAGCILSQFARGVPIPQQRSCGTPEIWLLTFTESATPLPAAIPEFICDTIKPEVVRWLQREANAYGQELPFSEILCLQDRIVLSQDLSGECPWCLNDPGVISYLEGSVDGVKDAKFVTIFYYLDNPDSPFVQHAWDAKYDFYFFRIFPDPFYEFYPALDMNGQGETLIHELLHKLGATDKYYYGWEQACITNPDTGQEYSGYDIMCHRVPSPGGGEAYIFPPLSDLKITEPTAREIGWLP